MAEIFNPDMPADKSMGRLAETVRTYPPPTGPCIPSSPSPGLASGRR